MSIHINAGGGTGSEIEIEGAGGQAEKAANAILPYLVAACGWTDRGVKVANLQVLRDTSMPAILTEKGFIDTASDAVKLADPNFRQAIAVAHAKGICDYFGMEYKEKGGSKPMKEAIVFWSLRDFSSEAQIASALGNCGTFCRNEKADAIHPDAKGA